MKKEDLPKHIQDCLKDVLDVPSGISDTSTKACLRTLINASGRKTCDDIVNLEDTPDNCDLILRANCHDLELDPSSEEAQEEWGPASVSSCRLELEQGCLATYILHLLNKKETGA